ncbi:hypothetical protein [uncultured Arenimonas sp.]|uniref:hypothetical protein n=1 Tax=uncultured Arenimonas sp. TaxID=546226 RepID=UPI0030D85497
MTTTTLLSRCLAALALAALAACGSEQAGEEPKPQQAGKAPTSLETAARLASIQGAAAVGDQEAVRRNVEAMTEDFRKAIRLADPSRAVDREKARAAARDVPGVRSVVWLDGENLFATVESADARSYRTIDRICVALEPLGDTLGVVVNLQNSAARNGDELEILSRNCQLAPGERAFLSRERKIDVIDPEIRAMHRANQALSEQSAEELDRQEESLRILEESTPSVYD